MPGLLLSAGVGETSVVDITAQEILARVDMVLEYPTGIIKGKIMHVTPDGRSNLITLKGYISEEDYLFKFSTKGRGERLNVLYNLGGEDIWVYNIYSIKLFNKRGIDKYDPILMTNFYYIDLSNYDFQSNYRAKIIGEVIVKGYNCYKMKLHPIYKIGKYGLLTIYVSKKDYIPLRIDFHDRDRVIFKTLAIAKVVMRNGRDIPIRYDMLDINKGTVTILEFYDFIENVKLNKRIFRHQVLGEAK